MQSRMRKQVFGMRATAHCNSLDGLQFSHCKVTTIMHSNAVHTTPIDNLRVVHNSLVARGECGECNDI